MRSSTYATALITGASSGIGAALARRLAERGTKVYLAARRLATLEALAGEIRRAGGAAEPLALDCHDGTATYEAVKALDARDPLDLVIANAGISHLTSGKRLDWAKVAEVLQVNLLGAAATVSGAL